MRRRERVEARQLTLHGWHCVIEDGKVPVFDVRSGAFIPASDASHSGTGPYREEPCDEDARFNEIQQEWPR